MTGTDDILGQIDDAVSDWTVSADAMRSQPAETGGWQHVGHAMFQVDLSHFVVDHSHFVDALMRASRTMENFLKALHAVEHNAQQNHLTRRTVQVATRKYKARRKR